MVLQNRIMRWGVFFVLVVAASWVLHATWDKKGGNAQVIIEQEGVVVYQNDLLKIEKVLTFSGLAGDYEVEFSYGKVRMKSSHCPDKICVNQGWVSRPQMPIICLPQKIIIFVEYESEPEEGVDVVQ